MSKSTRIGFSVWMFLVFPAAFIGLASPVPAFARERAGLPTLAEKTAGMRKFPGFFNFWWDAKEGKIWLEIDKPGGEFLYVHSLQAGVGSNDIGLDRGQLGRQRVVKFERIEPRVLLIQPNIDYRAVSSSPDEHRAVQDSFAQSVLWGADIAAEEGDRVLVDATSWLLRDEHNVADTLKQTRQGAFRLDPTRCAFYLPNTRNFPDNTEIEALLTFAGDEPGPYVRQVVPTPQAVTVREHHSFIRLPDDGYTPRAFDPRSGYYGISYADYATPIDAPLVKRFISRRRLRKKDPTAPLSEPVKPIVYYLDRGAPEPIRSALLEGAGWWNQAFEAAGYKNAFRVELLPEDADPMDVRYNVIQWVHRATRGWSYGGGIIDPRTGEILQGHVLLGSLRVRQDYLIAEGLLAPYETGKPVSKEMERMALARLRQLAAHEVGHTLGLVHNYVASTANRASVMDYPHPLVKIRDDGTLDLSDAYAVGIGEWDKVAIDYGYREFPAGTDEGTALNDILAKAAKRGLICLSDQDARPQGSAHPQTHLWDNGADAVDELARMMRVRNMALERFGENVVRPGAPLAAMEETLVPIYLSHRYQVEAAAKVLGGMKYAYALRGDGQSPTEMLPPETHRKALTALLATLDPKVLALPERILRSIPPRPLDFDRHRELFPNRTGGTFDPLSAVETAADHTVGLILNSERAARLVEFHARDARYPSFGEVLDTLLGATWKAPVGTAQPAETRRAVNAVVLRRLMELCADERASTQVRAVAWLKLDQLKAWCGREIRKPLDDDQRAHVAFAVKLIEGFEREPKKFAPSQPSAIPPGQPIGTTEPTLGCDW